MIAIDLPAQTATNFFINYIGQENWEKRRHNIHSALAKSILDVGNQPKLKDQVGLYLYLLTNTFNFKMCHNPCLTARLLPFFHLIGVNLDTLNSIKNIEKIIGKFTSPSCQNPLDTLYEICVALHYALDNWSVEIIPPKPGIKSPDIKISKNDNDFFIECKCLNKDYDYRIKEKKAFDKLWYDSMNTLSDALLWKQIEVQFKQPIESISSGSFRSSLNKLLEKSNGKYSDKMMDISIRNVDQSAIRNQLSHNRLHRDSPNLVNLLFSECDHYSQYHFDMRYGDIVLDENTNTPFIGEISHLWAAKWDSISEDSLKKKARNIKRVIRKKIKQISAEKNGLLHIGYETEGSRLTEDTRSNIMDSTIKKMNLPLNIMAVFINAFKGVSTKDNYEWDETFIWYKYWDSISPLFNTGLIFEHNNPKIHGKSHWDQD